MLFSVIIPVYNVESYLGDCLDSVLNQTFDDWEAICVDDGSSDGSGKVLEEYARKDGRIKVIWQKNAGTAQARNTGLEAARGDYVFFLDSDDWIEPNALQTLAERLNGEEVLCFSGRRYFEDQKHFNLPDQLPEKQYDSGMSYYNENALLHRDFAFVCVVLRIYDRAFLIREHLFFDADNSFEDNLWVPMMLYYVDTLKVISDSLYVYRVHEGSKIHEVSLKRKKDMLKVANRLAAFFVQKQDFDKTEVYRAITHHFQAAFLNVERQERKELAKLCDWKLYWTVSRTKPRHRWNFLKNWMKR